MADEARFSTHRPSSPRFRRQLPLLVGVPGFEGIRIHPGNYPSDTEGCLLPGQSRLPDAVMGSRLAFECLFAKLLGAVGPHHITITVEPAP